MKEINYNVSVKYEVDTYIVAPIFFFNVIDHV